MNRTLFRVEWLRWVRTRRLLAVVAAFVVLALMSPLGAKYLTELIGNSAEIKVLHEPDWRDGLGSYVKNGMLLMFVGLVPAVQSCAVRADDSVGLFYLSRETSPVRLYLPRFLVVAAVTGAVTVLGAATALYECWALFGLPALGAAVSVLAVQGIALVLFVVSAGAASALARSASRGGLAIAGVYVLSLLVSVAPRTRPYLPTTALQPAIGDSAISLGDTAKSLAVLVILTVLMVGAALVRPIRGPVTFGVPA